MAVAVAQFNALPAVAEIGGAEQVATQAEGDHNTGLRAADHAEERALIRRLDLLPGFAHVGGAEHAAHFANHEQAGAFDMGNGIQVEAVFVLEPVADVVPALAAVDGFDQRTIGTDRNAVLGVFEPHVEQGCFTLAIFVLHLPALSAVAGRQDQGIVADRPAMLVVDEIDGRQQLTGRHLGLGPAVAAIVGIEDMATIPGHDQAITGFGDIEQKVGCGFRRLDGIAGLAIGSSLDRRRCRQQQERNGAA